MNRTVACTTRGPHPRSRLRAVEASARLMGLALVLACVMQIGFAPRSIGAEGAASVTSEATGAPRNNPRSGASEVRVRNLRLASEAGAETGRYRFDKGTTELYAIFDYSGADSHEFGVVVTGRGGLDVSRHTRSYSGAGTESIKVDGSQVTRTLAGQTEEAARAAREDARLAAVQPFGVQEYLFAVRGSLLRIGLCLDLLEGSGLGEAARGQMASLRQVAAEAGELADKAIRLPMAEQKRKQELAAMMDEPLTQCVATTAALRNHTESLSDLPIPETSPHPRSAYAVQLQVGGLPAGVAEFLVTDEQPIYLPVCERP